MASVSVSEAALRLGVGVARIHQRIADGSLRAERLGSQWAIDELSLLRVAERTEPGRPLSARSAWAIVAVAEGDERALSALAPIERARAHTRFDDLLSIASRAPRSERHVRAIASSLRKTFRNRAERVPRKASVADLVSVRADTRWQSTIGPAASGIASIGVDGYLDRDSAEAVDRAYLLQPAEHDANVVIHVLPDGQHTYPDSKLLLAVDLAEQRGPREELKSAQLLHELALERRETRQ